MSDQFVGEIRLLPFNFAPAGWLLCAGQTLPISQNTALYSLIGTIYGGNGTSTFCLPNLQGQVIVGAGQGAGLSSYVVGETLGMPAVTLQTSELAPHTHGFMANTNIGTVRASAGNQLSEPVAGGRSGGTSANVYNPAAPNTAMSPLALTPAGANQQHNNMQPYLAMSYCISVTGVFPQRP